MPYVMHGGEICGGWGRERTGKEGGATVVFVRCEARHFLQRFFFHPRPQRHAHTHEHALDKPPQKHTRTHQPLPSPPFPSLRHGRDRICATGDPVERSSGRAVERLEMGRRRGEGRPWSRRRGWGGGRGRRMRRSIYHAGRRGRVRAGQDDHRRRGPLAGREGVVLGMEEKRGVSGVELCRNKKTGRARAPILARLFSFWAHEHSILSPFPSKLPWHQALRARARAAAPAAQRMAQLARSPLQLGPADLA